MANAEPTTPEVVTADPVVAEETQTEAPAAPEKQPKKKKKADPRGVLKTFNGIQLWIKE